MIDQRLRALRIEHDQINRKRIGSLTEIEKRRMVELRQTLEGTPFDPGSPFQTEEACNSIYGKQK